MITAYIYTEVADGVRIETSESQIEATLAAVWPSGQHKIVKSDEGVTFTYAPDGNPLAEEHETNPDLSKVYDVYESIETGGVWTYQLQNTGTRYEWHPDGWLEAWYIGGDFKMEPKGWWNYGQRLDTAAFYATYPVDKQATPITFA